MIGKLGKNDYREDERTAKMASFINREVQIPVSFDFDQNRVPFLKRVWGNYDWGDCVLAGQANDITRKERKETRKTVKISDEDVISRYKGMTGAHNPGDSNDNGLIVLDALNVWRHEGWRFQADPEKLFTIAAFGFLEPTDHWLLRACNYFFSGIHIGFNLPMSANSQTDEGYWDVPKTESSDSKPGSWGGHLVYSKRYDPENIYVLTWGQEIRVTNAFMERYADEAWATVDSLDGWRRPRSPLDISGMVSRLRGFGVKIEGA